MTPSPSGSGTAGAARSHLLVGRGQAGLQEACLAYVQDVWTDVTPKSLRKQTPRRSRGPSAPAPALVSAPHPRHSR